MAERNETYPECSTGAACCLTNCLNDITSSMIKCLIPFVESSCSNPKSNGTSHNGSSAGSCQTDRLLSAHIPPDHGFESRYRKRDQAGMRCHDLEKGYTWMVRIERLTKGVPKTPDIRLSWRDQRKVISPVDQGLEAKHSDKES